MRIWLMLRKGQGLLGLAMVMTAILLNSFSVRYYEWSVSYTVKPVLFFDDFNEHTPPEAPDGWKVLAGTWQTATDGTIVYEQTDTTSRKGRSVTGDTSWTDYTFEAKTKFVISGTNSRRGAVLYFRYQDDSNYYFLRMLEDNDELKLFRRIGGTNTRIGSAVSVALVQDLWYTVKISIEGQTINVWVDDTHYFTNRDSGGTLTNGKIGVGTKYYNCRFDDVKVSPIPP